MSLRASAHTGVAISRPWCINNLILEILPTDGGKKLAEKLAEIEKSA